MRTLLLTALAMSAVAGVASAQINAPNPPDLHNSGSLLWPRDDSYAYLRGHGIDKDQANIVTETLTPQGRRVSTTALGATAPIATQRSISAQVPQYGYMPSTWHGTWQEWMAHQDACAAKYRSYDRSTDFYYYKPGQRQYCNAGLRDGAH